MIKGYIFDLDGTLIDSMKVWDKLSIHYLESLDIIPESDLHDKLETMSIKEGMIYLNETYHLNKSIDDLSKEFHEQLKKEYQTVTLKPGVIEFLEKCYQKHIKMYILTANHQDIARDVLKRLNIYHYFTRIYTCQEIGYDKDDIRCFQHLIQHIDLSIQECVVVEDALYALRSAKQAGFYVQAVSDESNQRDWSKICQKADESYQTLFEMEVKE